MIITFDEKTNTRIQSWSKATNQPPETLIHEALNQSLDNWDDYMDALRICAEVDRGTMQTYTLNEVEKHLDALEH